MFTLCGIILWESRYSVYPVWNNPRGVKIIIQFNLCGIIQFLSFSSTSTAPTHCCSVSLFSKVHSRSILELTLWKFRALKTNILNDFMSWRFKAHTSLTSKETNANLEQSMKLVFQNFYFQFQFIIIISDRKILL